MESHQGDLGLHLMSLEQSSFPYLDDLSHIIHGQSLFVTLKAFALLCKGLASATLGVHVLVRMGAETA